MAVKSRETPFAESYCWVCGRDARGRQLVTIREAAEFCRVSINCVYQWMQRGLVEWVYNAGGKRRIYKDSLIRQPGGGESQWERTGIRDAGESEAARGGGR